MIPRAHITAWRARAPWPSNEQIEQDLVLSRALVAMFQLPAVVEGAAFRGGTALHKVFLSAPGRYSEDIDLVLTRALVAIFHLPAVDEGAAFRGGTAQHNVYLSAPGR
ncbi:MAG: nucleotidyl transferase AbiEii/AbiGii toxin family protein [Thermoanaerobaculaceae bacterium]|nr:nucleotidyl transferase AbiEii/AbiGii toxin family protein [Thermoanaerobaculaceae bacterium]